MDVEVCHGLSRKTVETIQNPWRWKKTKKVNHVLYAFFVKRFFSSVSPMGLSWGKF